MLNGKELQVGKSYKTHRGSYVVIESYNESEYPYCWESSVDSYTEDGYIYQNKNQCSDDLIEEHLYAPEEFNAVTKPKHYQLFPEFGIEVKDVVALLCNRLGTNGYNGAFIADFAQMLQYVMRFDEKNGKEDLEKAKEFLGGMLESYPDVQQLKGQK